MARSKPESEWKYRGLGKTRTAECDCEVIAYPGVRWSILVVRSIALTIGLSAKYVRRDLTRTRSSTNIVGNTASKGRTLSR